MNYPKMLYLGGLDNHAIANNEDEELELLESGYITHADAVQIEPKVEVGSSDDLSDQLGEAYEHIERLESAIEKLQDKLAVYESAKDINSNGKVDYDEMTSKELQALLDQRKVDYKSRDSKDALVKLAQDSE